MKDFINFLGEKTARYYYDLYISAKHPERKEECLERVKKIDEYALLLDVIRYLPFDIQSEVISRYNEKLEDIEIFNS